MKSIILTIFDFFLRIVSKVKAWFDAIDNQAYKENILHAIPFWVGAFITGLTAVFYAKLFALAELGTAYLFGLVDWIFFIITPLCFFASWWVVNTFAPSARGSGIPQVSAAIELCTDNKKSKLSSLLSLRIILIKIISSMIMVLGGGVIGREGPTIQISASIFKIINDLLPEWYPRVSKRNMIVTGAAAGLAAAFNTPLGGIVFAIEELTKVHFSHFKSALLVGVIISGLTALNILGPYLYLGYPQLGDLSLYMIFFVIPVAVISGSAGSGMGRTILWIFNKKRTFTWKYASVLYPLFMGLIIALLGYFISYDVFGSGKDIMVTSLFTDDKHLEWYVPILRLIGPIVSFSNGASGGIFAPSLSAGASIGAVVSGWMQLSASQTNLMILCGMTGCLTGITRSPFTSSILVIEMTNSHNIIFHLMLSALMANIISGFVSKKSFYDHLRDHYINEIRQKEQIESSKGIQLNVNPLP